MLLQKVFMLFGLSFCAFANDESINRKAALYDIVDNLLNHAKYDIQNTKIAVLLDELRDAKHSGDGQTSTSYEVANTYTRWGRRTCPNDSILVHEGVAAGSMYTDSGAASNYLCLPMNPDWNNKSEHPVHAAPIYGSEYETHEGTLHNLYDHEVPCAVCRVPRNNIIMIPGKNTCFKDYKTEYHGYLMAGLSKHKAATEYVCVDGEAEQASNSIKHNHNGALFYFVRAKCGSLKCPPYKENDELTCVVCSYSPKH